MLGLRWIGLATAVAVSLVCAFYMWWIWDPAGLHVPLFGVGIVSAGIGIGWLTLVKEGAVALGAERYANSLLEAAHGME